ncbi:hypothetical protein UJ101_01771 [Flavobacteriaceae bacterium UJ101]|nr:hypothetical protein UJ101_01771 [Flavobacteriaceae bacterium UJ101]
MKNFIYIFFLYFICIPLFGQEKINIDLIVDDDRGSDDFVKRLKKETRDLLENSYTIDFRIKRSENSIQKATELIKQSYQDNSDIVVSIGFLSSSALATQMGNNYPKPSIAGITLQYAENESSGIHNYTYVESPFSVEEDIKTFKKIVDFKRLGIFVDAITESAIKNYLNQFKTDFEIEFIPLTHNVDQDLQNIPTDIDAVYLLPYNYSTPEAEEKLIHKLNDLKIPTFALIGRNDVEKGALAGLASSDYIPTYTRRIALNIMKIAEGKDPKDFPVHITGVENDFVINMETAKKIGVYPNFEVLSEATLLNIGTSQQGRKLSLEGAVLEALENNLDLKISQADINVQEAVVRSAKSNLYPQLSVNTSATLIDNTSANLQLGTVRDELSWIGNAQLSQVVYSEPTYANIAIQKLLQNVREASFETSKLDIFLNVSTAYLRYLQAKANLEIQKENVDVTKRNLDLSKTKEKIGHASAADVYRFETSLAQNNMTLNDAITNVEQAKFSLNQLLNRPKNEDFVTEDVTLSSNLLFIADPQINEHINNQFEVNKFSDFLIDYAFEHIPSIEQVNLNIQAQERSLKSNRRSLYLPQANVQGNVNQTFGRFLDHVPTEQLKAQGYDPYKATWNVVGTISLPIFQGWARKAAIQQDEATIDQLYLTKSNTEQAFETNIRTTIENVGNSYGDVLLSQKAADASKKYLQITQDLYREGATNITTLLDAQNSSLTANLNAINARYQLVLDALTAERYTGLVYMLASDEEKEEFIQLFNEYLLEK